MRVPILTYHSIDESGSVLSVAPADFRAHLRVLVDGGFRPVRFDRLVDAFEHGTPLPPRPVVLTFDDAFANFHEHAAPALSDAGFTATVFVVAGRVGGRNDWDDGSGAIPRLPLLGWPALRELSQAGFEIGSHTFSHAHLDRAAPAALEHELGDARRALEDGVGAPVTTLAYPFGAWTPAAAAAARRHYRGACTTRLATARRGQDRHLLPRLDAYYLREPRRFAWLGTPAGSAYLAARAAGRFVRGMI